VLALVACGGDKDGDGPGTDDPVDDTSDTDVDDTDTDDTDPNPISVPTPTGDPVTVPLTGACPQESITGEFLVEAIDIFSIVDGSVADGVVPITVLEEMGAEGGCRLMRRNNPFCDPPCSGGETCDWDSTCIPFPANQDIGTVTLGGLAEDLILEPVVPGFQYFATQIPHPIFSPGDLIELRTWNTTYGDDIELHGIGVEPISLGGADRWVIFDNQDLTVTWTPPTGTPRSHIHMQLNIDQHGQTPVQLFCEFDDTGTGVVPTSLLTQLIGFGVSGFPNATLSRRTVDSTTMGDGCVQLRVNSPTNPEVRVDGFIPCLTANDCPTGQTCDPVTFICN
jgi:hypothetical protein